MLQCSEQEFHGAVSHDWIPVFTDQGRYTRHSGHMNHAINTAPLQLQASVMHERLISRFHGTSSTFLAAWWDCDWNVCRIVGDEMTACNSWNAHNDSFSLDWNVECSCQEWQPASGAEFLVISVGQIRDHLWPLSAWSCCGTHFTSVVLPLGIDPGTCTNMSGWSWSW